jgi:hypothetical protein
LLQVRKVPNAWSESPSGKNFESFLFLDYLFLPEHDVNIGQLAFALASFCVFGLYPSPRRTVSPVCKILFLGSFQKLLCPSGTAPKLLEQVLFKLFATHTLNLTSYFGFGLVYSCEGPLY